MLSTEPEEGTVKDKVRARAYPCRRDDILHAP
jgi:hypothetical protein